MFLVVLSLCVASCLAGPSVGYSYSAYAPPSHGYSPYSYSPYYAKSVYPYGYPFVYNQPAPVIQHVPVELKTQYFSSDIYGQASYGHSDSHQSQQAVQDAYGNKVGSFSYVKPDGQIHVTNYVADANGYRVVSNDLPVAPIAPGVPVVPNVEVPVAPTETPEVVAAKEAHFAAHAKALAGGHSLHKRSVYGYPSPAVLPNGYISDTPEVAAAKAAHFAEHAKRGNYYAPSTYAPVNAYYSSYAHHPIVTPDGYLADTPEVAAAKSAHLAEKAKVSGQYYHGIVPSVLPYAPSHPVVVGADGHILDTPEVAAAKSAHFAEHAAAAARNSAIIPVAAHIQSAYPHFYAAHTPSYYANPIVLPNGHLADTPDVAHAKAAHFAEYAKVAHRQKRSILELTPAITSPYGVPVAPVAPFVPHSYPTSYGGYPFFSHLGHTSHTTTVVHGPHAVSYSHQQS